MKPAQLKKISLAILILIAIILALSLVSAIGITYPHPQNIELKPGESSYFTFQIQTDDYPVTCVPIIEETQGLELAFNQQYEVEANQKFVVKPQVIVPKQTPLGSYKARFCIRCSPSGESEGSTVIPTICNLPITVNAVSERTGKNVFEEKTSLVWLWITLLIIAVIILAIVIYFLIRRKRVMRS